MTYSLHRSQGNQGQVKAKGRHKGGAKVSLSRVLSQECEEKRQFSLLKPVGWEAGLCCLFLVVVDSELDSPLKCTK